MWLRKLPQAKFRSYTRQDSSSSRLELRISGEERRGRRRASLWIWGSVMAAAKSRNRLKVTVFEPSRIQKDFSNYQLRSVANSMMETGSTWASIHKLVVLCSLTCFSKTKKSAVWRKRWKKLSISTRAPKANYSWCRTTRNLRSKSSTRYPKILSSGT